MFHAALQFVSTTVSSLGEASGERAEALEDVEMGGVHGGREKTQEEKKRMAEEVATERLAAKRLTSQRWDWIVSSRKYCKKRFLPLMSRSKWRGLTNFQTSE